MSSRIERLDALTDDQVAMLPAIRDEWIGHGLSCEPANRETARAGIDDAYRAAGLAPPRLVVWLASPIAGAIGQAMVSGQVRGQVSDQVSGQVRGQVWGQVWGQVLGQVSGQVLGQVSGQVRGQVWGQVSGQVWGQVSDQVWGQVWDQVWGQVWDQVRGQVSDQVWGQVRDQVSGQVRDQVRGQVSGWSSNVIEGNLWAGTWSFYDAFARLGLECCAPMSGLIAVAKSAGWWWPFNGCVVITDRPATLCRDNLGRLHNEHGASMTWRDGWAIHHWHGTPVPAELVSGDGWAPDRILAEKNAEVRRCAIERRGWGRFIHDCGATEVGRDADPGNAGQELALYDLPGDLGVIGDERVRVLVCANGTIERDGARHTFGLTVPAEIQDPVGAAAWTFGVDRAEYLELGRRT